MTTLDIRCRIKHLLHTWSSLGTFVRDDDYISANDLTTKNTITSRILRVKHFSRATELPNTLVNPGSFNYATVLGNITKQHSESAILRICMLNITDTSFRTVGIECTVNSILTSHHITEHVCRSTTIYTFCLCTNLRTCNIIFC